MDWKKLITTISGITAIAAPVVKQIVRNPILDTILNAVVTVEKLGGTGPEKMAAALELLSISKPFILDLLEKQLGVVVPEEAVDKYIAAQTQANVDLLNAVHLLPKKVVAGVITGKPAV